MPAARSRDTRSQTPPPTPETPRVVITGIGMVTSVGNDTATTWKALLEGRSGVGPVREFDISDYDVKIAA